MGGYSHVGIRGNEMADEIANARKDAEKSPVGPERITGVTQQHVNASIKGHVFQEHYCRWSERVGCGSWAVNKFHRRLESSMY